MKKEKKEHLSDFIKRTSFDVITTNITDGYMFLCKVIAKDIKSIEVINGGRLTMINGTARLETMEKTFIFSRYKQHGGIQVEELNKGEIK